MKTCECESTRRTTKLFNYSVPELNDSFVWTHKDCVCNEAVALSQRHQVNDGSAYTSKQDLWKYLRPLTRLLTPSSEEYIINRYSGAKKTLMLQAQEDLLYNPICPEDGKVKMFLKADKSHELKYPAPRCIQYRDKRYCLRLATYLHPIEEMLYTRNDCTHTPIFAKSRNLTQRGQDLRAKWEHFDDPVALLLDHSKFDAHCNEHLLALEHKFYAKCITNANGKRELKKLLKWQMLNKGTTKNGTKYITKATRMSGDQNTGCGNSIINYAMLKAFSDKYQLKAAFYVDGDDSVLVCDRRMTGRVSMEYFKQYGMVTVMDQASEFSKVEFCQTRPVFDGASWRMVRNPVRLLARLPWIVYNLPENCWERYLKSVGMCEMALGVGLPIGQYIGETLSKLSKKKYMITDLHYVAKREYSRPGSAKVVTPTAEARASYEEAWGLDLTTQLQYEQATLQPPELGMDCLADYDEEPFLHMQ